MTRSSAIQFFQKSVQFVQTAQVVASWLNQAEPARPALHLPKAKGIEGLAYGSELQRYLYTPQSFYLGRFHADMRMGEHEAGIDDDRHAFIMAGNRTGKGVGPLAQNAIRWPGGLLAIDPRSELANITAMRRGTVKGAAGSGTSVRLFLEQPVAILDPMGETRGPARVYRTGYNPLVDINMNDGGGVRQIWNIASACVTQESGTGAHFSESAETLVAGTIEAVMRNEPPENRTLPFVRSVMLAGFEELLEYLSRNMAPHGLAHEARGMLIDIVGNEEAGSFRTTLSRNLKWMSEPAMRAHLTGSGFSLRRAVQENASVYIVVPPDMIADFKSWLRILVRIAISAKIALGSRPAGPQSLFLLDEFPVLGRIKAIEESAGYMAGYGIKLVPVIQNIGQVQQLYDKNWETFLGNAGAIIAWGLNDGDSEEYVSRRMGRVMVWETARGINQGQSSQGAFSPTTTSSNTSESTALHERPVLRANEIHVLGARETGRAFVLPASGKPFIAERVPYMQLQGQGVYDSPEFISAWEAQRAGAQPSPWDRVMKVIRDHPLPPFDPSTLPGWEGKQS